MKTVGHMINQSVYLLLDNFISKIFNLIIFIMLTHALSTESIGIIGVSLGYLVMINYIALTPEGILLKEKLGKGVFLSKKVTGYMSFWALKSVALLILTGGIGLFLYLTTKNTVLTSFFVIFGIVNVTNMFVDLMTFLFFIKYRQKLVCYINIFFSVLTLCLVTLLFIKKDILLYGGILLGISIARCITYFTLFKIIYEFKFNTSGMVQDLKSNIKKFSLWHHLNNVSLQWIFYIDTVILSFFVGLSVIGDYTVALKISFLAFQVSMLLERVMSITFKTLPTQKEGIYLGSFIKYFSIKSAVQIIGFLILGKPILTYVFKVQDVTFTYTITLLIIIGISIMNIVWPMISYIIAKHSIKKYFLHVTLPTILISLVCYTILTAVFGPFGTAVGNIINYSIFAYLMIAFVKPKVRIIFSRELDKEIFSTIRKKIYSIGNQKA